MLRVLTFLIVLVFAQASFGQLSGSLSGTLGPGEYNVIGTISVESGDSLRLMPGTIFNFNGPYAFNIYGTLLAEGTGSDSIVFTTDVLTNPNRWRGLHFGGSGSSGSWLAFCLVEKGYGDGGIYCYDYSSPCFTNCTLCDNSGRGVSCFQYSSPTFANCTVTSNWANSYGGGVGCWSNSSPTFTNCTINGNSADDGGGISCTENSSPTFTNCILSGNYATYSGGGVNSSFSSSPIFTNCTLCGNSAYYDGGGVYCSSQASPSFINCILWANTPEQIFLSYGSSAQVTYSDVQDGWPGTGNINVDPLFVDAEVGDYHILVGSPCIDAGDPDSPLDPDSTIADIGAFYYDQLEIVVEPLNLDFDSVFVGNIGMLTCMLYNPSYSVIIIQSISINDSAFSHDWNLADSVLAAGDSLQIAVTFAPYLSTVYEDSLSIETDHHDKIVPLSGFGLGAYLVTNPPELDFGAVEPGYPETLSVTCKNFGNINLELAEILDCPPEFQVLQPIDSTIAPDDSTTLQIQFDPQSFGHFECDLGIISSAFNADTAWVSLYGEGGLTPAPVKDLTIVRAGIDALLRWSLVDTTAFGNPVTVDYYIVYHSQTVEGPYYFLGSTDTTTYSHASVIPFEEMMFYEVTAYVGSIGLLQGILAEFGEHPRREELSKRLGRSFLTAR